MGKVNRPGRHKSASKILIVIIAALAGLCFLGVLMSITRTWVYRHNKLVIRIDDATLSVSRVSHYGMESAVDHLTDSWHSNLEYADNVHYCIDQYRHNDLLEPQWSLLTQDEGTLRVTQEDYDDENLAFWEEQLHSCSSQLAAVIEDTRKLRADIAGAVESYHGESLDIPARQKYLSRLEEQQSWLEGLRARHGEVLATIPVMLQSFQGEGSQAEREFSIGQSFSELWRANEEFDKQLAEWRETLREWGENIPQVPRPRFWSNESPAFHFVKLPAFTRSVPGVWRLVIPLWLPFSLSCVLLMCLLMPSYRARRRLGGGQCPRCGYSLIKLTVPRCPECGVPLDPKLLHGAGGHQDSARKNQG